ncbi:MAG: hypothetical protein AB2693_01015 [Candidatus Thiodiazotropha sp.]
MNGYCFKSNLFEIEPGEDEKTNPNRFGKQLAHWLKGHFVERGYQDAEAIPEDWGWCVMCSRSPYNSWIGCGNVDGKESQVLWKCFVEVEVSLIKRLFSRRNPMEVKADLEKELYEILSQSNDIEMMECP